MLYFLNNNSSNMTSVFCSKSKLVQQLAYAISLAVIIFLLTAIGGCKSTLDKDSYLQYLSNSANGLVKSHYSDLISATCSYRPNDLFISQELEDLSSNSTLKASIDSLSNIYDDRLYCELSLAVNGVPIEKYLSYDINKLQKGLYYLNNDIINDVYLHNGIKNDSICASQAIYIRSYGNPNNSTILLLFNHLNFNKDYGFTVTYSSELLGIKYLKFDFTGNDIKKLPKLKMI